MTEVTGRVRFEDAALHRPEFLDIHEVLQAASQPSVEQFGRAISHLDSANYDRFVKLVEVAQEQAPGIGESDLRRLKRQFASLKNTFMLYDVKQSFLEGLAEGFPDGSEETQIKEFEDEAEKQSSEVKKLKARNEQMTAELAELIQSTATEYNKFCQERIEIMSHLECLSTEKAEEEKHGLEPLPKFEDGPDENVCRALLASASSRTQELEQAIASQQALRAELQAAIVSEEQELQNLEAQISELEAKDIDEVTQDLRARFTDSAEWCEEMIKLTSALTGVQIVSVTEGRLELRLELSLTGCSATKAYDLTVKIDSAKDRLQNLTVSPADVAFDNILATEGNTTRDLSAVVLEIQARLSQRFAESFREENLKEIADAPRADTPALDPMSSNEEDSEWQPEEATDDTDAQDSETAQAEEDDADAEELEDDFLGARLDPFALLENMAGNNQSLNTRPGIQPYEILANQARQARQKVQPKGKPQQKRKADELHGSSEEEEALRAKKAKKPKGKFGATVEDIWNDDLAAEMGVGSAKAQKKLRNRQRRRRRAQRLGKKTRDLPEEVTKRIGEANLLYATGKYSQAIPLLKEVIRLAPSLSDPYHTLGMLHQAVGEPRTALDFYMIAAHLTPKDADLWKRLASLSAEVGFTRQAIYCLSKVIARDKGDADARWDKGMLYVELEEFRKAVASFESIQTFRPGDGEVPLMVARLFHRLKQPEKACLALEKHISGFPLATKATHVNILAELYMEGKDYRKAAELMERTASMISTDATLPIDILAKQTICYVHLGRLQQARSGIDKLKADAVDGLYDLCLDVADALLDTSRPTEALELYKVVKDSREGIANVALWNKMLHCFDLSGDFEGAVGMFSEILLDPDLQIEARTEATIGLGEMLVRCKKTTEAMQVLGALDSESLAPLPPEIIGRKAKALIELGAHEEYLSLMLPVLEEGMKRVSNAARPSRASSLSAKTKQRKAIIAKKNKQMEKDGIFKGYVTQDRRKQARKQEDDRLATMLETSSEEEEEAAGNEDGVQIYDGRSEEQFNAILRTAEVLMSCHQPLQAAELLSECLIHFARRWIHKSKKDKVRILATVAALHANEPALSLNHIRHAISVWPHVNAVWNLFCKATVVQGSVRNVQKLLFVMSQSFTKCLPLRLALGHSHSMNGHFGNALEEYLIAYSLAPDNVLVLLCLGINYLNQCMSRKIPNRDHTILAAFTFLQKYMRLRENKQEAFYNMGRAAHQLNLTHLAVPWYQQALAAEAPQSLHTLGDSPQATGQTDLKRAIAYNLSKIYKASGADALARQIVRQYLTF